jgi:hypothetical protein
LIDHNVANEEHQSTAALVLRAGRFISVSTGIEIKSEYYVHIK